MPQKEGLLINSSHKFFIDITPDGTERTWSRLAKGLSSFDPSLNEENDQTQYLNTGTMKQTTVTGGQQTIAFEGHRYYGDEAQEYVFSKKYKVGPDRETNFKWEEPNGNIIECPCTIATIEGPGGDAGAKGEISIEIHLNGEPTETTATP
ncbi:MULTISPECIES: phage tail tube protein [Terrabacteria group]